MKLKNKFNLKNKKKEITIKKWGLDLTDKIIKEEWNWKKIQILWIIKKNSNKKNRD